VIDRQAPLRFLRTAYDPEDWVAVLLKSYDTGHAVQRVGPVNWIASPRFQAWLRAKNAGRANVFVSVNVVQPDQRSRRRDAVRSIRHLFLDVDRDASHVLAVIASRSDLPAPSYVLHSSRHRAHIFWRVTGFTIAEIEALQKRLAVELGSDPAATASSQLTRLPGFITTTMSTTSSESQRLGRQLSRMNPDDPRFASRHLTAARWTVHGGIWRQFRQRLSGTTVMSRRSESRAASFAGSRSTTTKH
jgi:hypothetical protein